MIAHFAFLKAPSVMIPKQIEKKANYQLPLVWSTPLKQGTFYIISYITHRHSVPPKVIKW